MDRAVSKLLLALLFAVSITLVIPSSARNDASPRQRYPTEDMGADSLPARKKAQLEAAKQFKVFHDFQFSDRLNESGITFVHHAVDDATKHMRMGHYDHGSAVAIADVDGDGLYDILFLNQVGGNELWKNLGGGRFKNMTEEAGIALAGRVSVAAAFADIDNDGDQDLFITTVRGGNALFENDGHGRFRDITKESGVDLVAHSSGAFFLTMTMTAWLICWSATSASTQPMKRGRMANTSEFKTHFQDIFMPIATNIPFFTKTWDTIASRM